MVPFESGVFVLNFILVVCVLDSSLHFIIFYDTVRIIVTQVSIVAIQKLVTENDVCRSQSSLNSCHNHQQNIFASVLKRVSENRDNDGMFLFTRCCAAVCAVRDCKGPYTLTSFLVPVAGAGQLAPVNWRVCHATGTSILLVPVTGTSRF